MPLTCRCNLSLTTGSVGQSKKRQYSTPYLYFTNSIPCTIPTHLCLCKLLTSLPKSCPPKTNKLTAQQVRDMRNWRAVYGQRVPKKLCEISMTTTKKTNPVTLPINLYAVGPPDVQPLDLTKLGDYNSVQHIPQKEVTERDFAHVDS